MNEIRDNVKPVRTNGKYDVWTHRILVCLIGVTMLSDLLLIAGLAAQQLPIPETLPAIAFASFGALSSMLAGIMRGSH